jgi:hypothetical protein
MRRLEQIRKDNDIPVCFRVKYEDHFNSSKILWYIDTSKSEWYIDGLHGQEKGGE